MQPAIASRTSSTREVAAQVAMVHVAQKGRLQREAAKASGCLCAAAILASFSAVRQMWSVWTAVRLDLLQHRPGPQHHCWWPVLLSVTCMSMWSQVSHINADNALLQTCEDVPGARRHSTVGVAQRGCCKPMVTPAGGSTEGILAE